MTRDRIGGPARGEETTMEIDWFQLLMGLFGGLALFLAGLELLSEGLKKATGSALKVALARLTTNRFTGAITGAFVTAVLNSSSVTTVLVVGFVTAGTITLAQSVGVIMGANIGSTVTAQLLAFNLSAYALLPVAVGFFMYFAGRRERTKQYGTMILGLGLVFFGMGVMSDAMKPLRSYEPFLELLRTIERPLLGVLTGALFTALVQSSAATVGIASALAAEGLLSLQGGIALALGANIGTCATALLAALGKPPEAQRAAAVHLSFNVIGVVLWLPLIHVLARLAEAVSPVSTSLEGMARMAADVPRQIANANSLFNVLNTAFFIGFTGFFARLAPRLVKDRGRPEGVIIEPRFLDEAALEAPPLALERARQELGRAGEIALGMLEQIGPAIRERDHAIMAAVAARDDEVDILEAAVLEYLGRIRQGLLTAEESLEHQKLMEATVNLESLADVVETDIVEIVRQAGEARAEGEVARMLEGLYETVCRAVSLAVRALRDNDQQAAQGALNLKEQIREQSERVLAEESSLLRADRPDYVRIIRLQSAFVDRMQYVYALARRIAKGTLPQVLAARE
jgi:phosphate:Na+ symporter